MLRRASFEGEVVAGEPADPCRRLRLKFSDRVFMPVLDLNQRRAMVSSSCLSTSRQLYAAAGCRRRSREGGYGRASPPVCSPTGTSGSFSPLGADRVTCALLVRHEHDAMTPDLRTGMPSSVRAFGHSGIRSSIAAVRLGARPPRRRDRLQSKSNRAAVFRGRAMRRRIRRRQRSAQAACRLRSASRVRSEKQSPRRSIADRGSHCGEGSGRSAARRRDARARTRASPPSSALRPPGG